MIEYLSQSPEMVIEESTARHFQIMLVTENGNYFYSPNGFQKPDSLFFEHATLKKEGLVEAFGNAVEMAKRDFKNGNLHIMALY